MRHVLRRLFSLLVMISILLAGCGRGTVTGTLPEPSATVVAEQPVVATASLAETEATRPVHFRMAVSRTGGDYVYRSFLQNPVGMTWGPDEYLYVADWMGRHIVRIAPDGSMDELVVSNAGQIWQGDGPRSVTFSPDGVPYFNDHGHIYRLGSDDRATALPGIQGSPVGAVLFSPAGELYYTDRGAGLVRKWNPDGSSGMVADGIRNAENMAFGLDGTLYVSQMNLDRVMKVNVETGQVSEFFSGPFRSDPVFLAVDDRGHVWIRGLNSLYRVAPDGKQEAFVVDGQPYPDGPYLWHTSAGIAFDPQGGLWIGSYNSRLNYLSPVDLEQADPVFARRTVSSGLEISSMDIGPDGALYAVDTNGGSLWRIGRESQVEILAADLPNGRVALAVDPAGIVYLGLPNGEVVRLEADGSLTHRAWLLTRRMVAGEDGSLYAIVGNFGQPKKLVHLTGVDQFSVLAQSINGLPLGQGEVLVSRAPGGLYLFSEETRQLFFTELDGSGYLVKNLSSLGGGGPAAMAAAPDGGVYFIPHGPYVLYHIDLQGRATEIANGIYGDPWDMVASLDGSWLYVAESGAIDRLPIGEAASPGLAAVSTMAVPTTVDAPPTVQPVVVPVLCTLMGRDPVTTVLQGQPIQLRWGWTASTAALVEEFVANSVTVVTLDGDEVENPIMGEIRPSGDHFAVQWNVDVGFLLPGSHTITYFVSFRKQISDGLDTYGPGGRFETLQDTCELVIQ